MIRMIGNNTSDYVATDLIHQLWCQHDEKYGHLFLDEPHQSKRPCTFIHSKDHTPIQKSANHYTGDNAYHEERLQMYARKHGLKNINNYYIQDFSDEEANDKQRPNENDEEAGLKNLMRKRIKTILTKKSGSPHPAKKKDPRLIKPKVVTRINDSTTNSDDTASRSEQDFNQHYAREREGLNEHR